MSSPMFARVVEKTINLLLGRGFSRVFSCSAAFEQKIVVTPKFRFGEKSKEKNENDPREFCQVVPKESQFVFNENISGDLLELEDNDGVKRHRKDNHEKKRFQSGFKPLYNRDGRSSQKQRELDKHSPEITGQEILFGIHPVLLALRAKRRQLHKLFLREAKPEIKLNPRLEEIKNLAEKCELPIEYVSKLSLDQLSGQRLHQSVCLDVDRLKSSFYEYDAGDRTIKARDRNYPIWLFLYKIHDPMNFGAILRTAYYLAVDKLICAKNDSCSLTPVVSKASSGVMEITPCFAVEDTEQFLKSKLEQDWEILGTTTNSKICEQSLKNVSDVFDYTLTRPTIVIVGNEGEGLDEKLTNYCTTHLTVSPGLQNFELISSLNVSVATGIILHALSKNKITK